MRRALLFCTAALSFACASVNSGGEDAGTVCVDRVPPNPSLVGMAADVRAALLERSGNGIVAVRYLASECEVVFELIEDCRASGRYVYESDVERASIIVGGEPGLAAALPIAAKHLAGRLAAHGLIIDVHRVGQLRAPASLRTDRGGLVGSGCAAATHVVTQIGVGGYALTRAKADELRDNTGLFTPDGAKASNTAHVGDPEVCARAARRGKRIDGCGEPLSSTMVRITNERVLSKRIQVGKKKVEIDRFEVTAGDYAACVANEKCTAAGVGPRCTAGIEGKESHPVNCVTWSQADTYCRASGQRLPTEEEWALGAGKTKYAWGKTWPPPEGVANLADAAAQSSSPHWEVVPSYVDGFADTAPVGSLGLSSTGMADAAGNVMEWTADWYDRRRTARVVRGSSYGHADAKQIALAHRHFYGPDTVSVHIGFRCVVD